MNDNAFEDIAVGAILTEDQPVVPPVTDGWGVELPTDNQPVTYKQALQAMVRLGTPLFLNACVMGLTNFLTAVELGNLGQKELAASPYIFAAHTLPALTGAPIMAVGMLSAIGFGAKEFESMGSILRNGQLFGIVLAVPSMGVIWYIKPIIEMIGCPENIAEVVQQYSKVYFFTAPIIQLALPTKFFIESIGAPKVNLVSDLLGSIVLLSAGGVLSYGAFGLPRLGVTGMACGSFLQFGTMLAVNELYLFTQRNKYRLYNFGESITKRFFAMKEIWIKGYPFIFLAMGHIGANYVMLVMATQFSELGLSAFNIATHYEMLFGIPMSSMLHSASILIGQSFGAKKYLSLRRYYDTGLCSALVYSAGALSLFMAFPDRFTSLFLLLQPNENIQGLTEILRPLYVAAFIGLVQRALMISGFAALKGIGNITASTIISVGARYLSGLPLSAVFAFALNFGIVGLALGDDLGMLAGAILLIGWWIRTVNAVFLEHLTPEEYESEAYFAETAGVVSTVMKKIYPPNSSYRPTHFQPSQKIVEIDDEQDEEKELKSVPFRDNSIR